jgi:cellulose synthase/poly-beta-1,6-N-acetylglucosamine synthase-like glycosyltransferase
MEASVHTGLAAIYWFSAGLIVYTFAGYPVLLRWLARIATRAVKKNDGGENTPLVSIALVAHNEASRIIARLKNLIESDFPPEKIEIIVVSDGSTDDTVEKIKSLAHPRVRLVTRVQREGKSACLNIALAEARGDIIVFSDARQRFDPRAIRELCANFSDPKIGAVSGALDINPATSGIGAGVDAYWRLEKSIRLYESKIDSCIGCTGAIYAIRRELFEPLPPDTILDDVVTPMHVALRGYRAVFDPAAVAFDPQPLEPHLEKIRKQRTLAGNFQMLARHPGWLLPWRNRLWLQLISHKYLRLAAPWLLLAAFTTNAALTASPFYRALFFAQCIFYALAIAGGLFPSKKIALLSLPAGFVFLNLSAMRGLWIFLTRRGGAWRGAR